jgi:farnesyl-diphosphate farnesyltransferase
MDRCYLPEDILARHGSSVGDVKGFMLSPGLRATIDEILDHVDRLNRIAEDLPRLVKDKRLKVETAMIVALAKRLTKRLRHGDPLSTRVKLTKPDFLFSLLGSLKWVI